VKAHFASLQPVSVRLRNNNKPGKTRGIAFVEFDRFDRMKTCLEKFHHSEFNDGKSAARQINVELT
jgi:nucleolar protein 6